MGISTFEMDSFAGRGIVSTVCRSPATRPLLERNIDVSLSADLDGYEA
jgi:hypothetical protein